MPSKQNKDVVRRKPFDIQEAVILLDVYISYIEKGKRLPSAPVIVKLSDALGISTDYLLTGEYGPKDYENQFRILADLDPEQRELLLDVLKAAVKVSQLNK